MSQKNTPTNLKRENGKVWIENVPALAWGKGKECTFAGALEATTAVTAHPEKYSDLMGWSALAFRVRWYHGTNGQPRWCMSSPVGEMPEEYDAPPPGHRLGTGRRSPDRTKRPQPHPIPAADRRRPRRRIPHPRLCLQYGYGRHLRLRKRRPNVTGPRLLQRRSIQTGYQ